MVEGVAALAGGFDHEHEAFFDAGLAGEFGEVGRAQGHIERCFGRGGGLVVEVFAQGGANRNQNAGCGKYK